MKNIPLFVSRILLLIIIAGLVSAAIGLILVFIFGNLNSVEQNEPTINTITGVAFGVMFGYKLNDIVREFKK